MATEELVVTVGMNSKQFKNEMKNVNQELRTAQKNFNTAAKTTQLLEDKTEGLGNEIKQLNNIYDSQSKKVNIIENRLKELDSTNDELSTSYNDLQKELTRLNTNYDHIKNAMGENSSEAIELKKTISNVEKEFNKVDKAISNNRNEYNRLSGELNTTQNELKYTEVKLESLQKELKDVETNKAVSELEKLQSELEDVQQESDNAGESIEGLANKFVALDFIGDLSQGMRNAIKVTVDEFTSMDSAITQIGSSLGITKEESEQLYNSAQNLSKNGFDFNEATNSIVNIKQVLGDALDPSQIEEFTGGVLSISKTFDTDFNDIIKATNSMVRNFGIEGQEALDIITWGFQNGANASGDMLDTMWEYSVQFSDLGYTAEETMQLIEQGMKNGTFNTDKLADSVKEANIRLKEMPKSTTEALESVGLDVNKIQKNISNGGEVAKNQMTDLAKQILNIKDPIKQNEVAVAVFGTMFEDLGIEGIKALANIDTSLMNTEGKTGEVKSSLEESFGMTMQGTMASFSQVLAEIGKVFAPIIEIVGQVAQKFAEFLSQNPAIAQVIALIMVFATVFIGLATVIGLTSTVFTAFGGVIAFISSPIGIAIAIISALVAVVVWLVNNWEWAWEQITSFVKWIGDGIVKGFNDACKFVTNLISSFISGIINFFSMLLKGIVDIITSIANGIIKQFNNACNFVINLVSRFINNIVSFFGNLWSSITSTISNITNSIRNGFNNALNSAVNIVNNLKNKVSNIFRNIPSTISNALSGLYNIITSPFRKAWSFISGIGKKIGNIASNIIGWLPFSITPDLENQLPNIPQMLSTVSVSGEMYTPQTMKSKSIQDIFNFTKGITSRQSSNDSGSLDKLIETLNKQGNTQMDNSIQILVQVGDKELKEEMYKYTVKRITRESKNKSKIKG